MVDLVGVKVDSTDIRRRNHSIKGEVMNKSSKDFLLSTITGAACVRIGIKESCRIWYTDGHSFNIKDGLWKERKSPFYIRGES